MTAPAAYRCPNSCVGEHSPECDAAFAAAMKASERMRDLRELCYGYNDATNPAAFRSDDEHQRCRERARELRAALRQRFREGVDYQETESGRMLPLAP